MPKIMKVLSILLISSSLLLYFVGFFPFFHHDSGFLPVQGHSLELNIQIMTTRGVLGFLSS